MIYHYKLSSFKIYKLSNKFLLINNFDLILYNKYSGNLQSADKEIRRRNKEGSAERRSRGRGRRRGNPMGRRAE